MLAARWVRQTAKATTRMKTCFVASLPGMLTDYTYSRCRPLCLLVPFSMWQVPLPRSGQGPRLVDYLLDNLGWNYQHQHKPLPQKDFSSGPRYR